MSNAKLKETELFIPVENNKTERFKDELNFAEFPLASLADHVPEDQRQGGVLVTVKRFSLRMVSFYHLRPP